MAKTRENWDVKNRSKPLDDLFWNVLVTCAVVHAET